MWRLLCQYLFLCLFFLSLNLQVVCSSFFNTSSPSPTLCSPEQSDALLHFKNTLSVDSYPSGNASNFYDSPCNYSSSYPKTNSWKEGSDCCTWDGIICDSITGHVIGLDLTNSRLYGTVENNSSLFLLHHLLKLNLSCNNFLGSNISSKFGQFTKLTHLNLSFSEFSGVVPIEISHLSKLVSLDFSSNEYTSIEIVTLQQHGFNMLAQNLTGLRYLHLDNVDMSFVASGSLANLSFSLRSISLYNNKQRGKFPNDLFQFPFLQLLRLSNNENITGNFPQFNRSSPLILLDLSSTNFFGKLPNTIGCLMHLNYLNLARCKFEGSIPPSFGNLTEMSFLDLSLNGFTGQVPTSLSKLVQLTRLDLSWNNFSGQFPDCFGNVSKLTLINLSYNNFSGQLPVSVFNLKGLLSLDFTRNQFHGQFPSKVSGLSYLTHLELYDNLVSGRLPSWLFNRPSLDYLGLANNTLTGPIEEFQQPGPMSDVILSYNEIQGPIPNSIFKLSNLVTLSLSNNNFSGSVKLDMLSELKNLGFFDLSYNSLLSLNAGNVTLPPRLEYLELSSCNITEFPIFFSTSNLDNLDLSNNRIAGRISLLHIRNCSLLSTLNLSHNFLTSFEFFPSMVNLDFLDLSSNLLQGQLVDLKPSTLFFSVSNNNLSGDIPPSFCNLSSIEYLDLSNNSLSGNFPQCLANSSVKLKFLDLRMNNFNGSIRYLKFPNDSVLTALLLNGNQLEGPLPPSLVNCRSLEILDVGNNRIRDGFPDWLGALQSLTALILRSNRFYGPIGNSSTRFSLTKLRILDLSHNQFTGLLPTSYFQHFEAMMRGYNDDVNIDYMTLDEFDIYYSITLSVKGVELEIDRILTIFTTIDLSNNLFQGPIPEVIRELKSLKLLNLSHNNLSSHLPSSLGNLTQLESLDLSFNKLIGKIPMQLISLTFLSVLNLSYNQLVGHVPQGKQFDTFQNDSYIGNLGLCGSPFSNKCGEDGVPSPTPSMIHEEYNALSWFDWKIALMGYGCGFVLGISLGYIVFTIRRPRWFVRLIERKTLRNVRRLNRGRRGRRE